MARPHPALLDLAAGRALRSFAAPEAEGLVSSALEHRVSGLLWTRVLAGEVVLPPKAVGVLARQDLLTQARNQRLWRTFAEVDTVLTSAGIEVAAVKGISAETRWYSRLGERPCNDLDLLLAPQSAALADTMVECLQPGHPLRGAAGRLMTSGVLQSIDLDVNGVEVDVHADLLKYEVPTRQPERVWCSTSHLIGPGGVRMRVLSAEMSLVHFLLHMNKDNFALLLAYADVARILARDGDRLDWGWIHDFTEGEGLQVHVYSALNEVVSLLGLVPPPVARPTGSRAAAWQRLWPPESRLQGAQSLRLHRHRLLWIPWSAQGRLPEAFRWWVRRRLFPPPALVGLYYPRTAGPYPWRLARGRWQVWRARVAAGRAETEGRLVAARPPVDRPGARSDAGADSSRYDVVIVHYRGSALLRDRLTDLSSDVPVVVVDNSRSLDSVERAVAQRPGTRYVDPGGNIGFAAAANLGAQAATADVVVFLNPDCSPSSDALDSLVGTVRDDASVAACGPALVDPSGAARLSGGWQPSVARALVHALGMHLLLRRAGIFVQPRLGRSLDVGWLSGACLAVRRDVLLAAGGFDERYFMYQEDMALGRRLAALGYRQVMRADVQVRHGGGASSDVASTWLWRQRGAALSSYIESGNGPVAAAAMRLALSSGFRLRSVYHASLGSRSRVAEMRTYAEVLQNAEPEPPRPLG